MKNRRGLSLAEVLVTLFILSLVISMAADLMRRARLVSNLVRQKSALQSAAGALQQLSCQLMGACKMVQPGLNGSSTQIQFVRVQPDLATRLPTTLGSQPSPEPAPTPVWDPCSSNWQETITVARDSQGRLVWTSSLGTQKTLTDPLTQFDCRSQGRLLEMTLQVLVRGQSQSVKICHLVESGVEW